MSVLIGYELVITAMPPAAAIFETKRLETVVVVCAIELVIVGVPSVSPTPLSAVTVVVPESVTVLAAIAICENVSPVAEAIVGAAAEIVTPATPVTVLRVSTLMMSVVPSLIL